MFCQGEYIVYGASGVCRIEGITNSPFGKAEETTYYILKPVAAPAGSSVFSPVGNNSVNMRALMTENDIHMLRETAPTLDIIKVDNEKLRKDAYRTAILSNDPADWVRILRTVGERRKAFIEARKRLPDADVEFESAAKKCLFHEIAIVLGTNYEAVAEKVSALLCGFFPEMQTV